MLDAATLFQNRVPDIVRILGLLVEQLFQIRVLDRPRPRQRLVRVDVGRDRLDAGARPAADDRDRRGGCDRHLAREALHHAHLGRVGAGAALDRQRHRRFVGLTADVFEHAQVPRLGHRAFHRQAARLEEAVEAHDAQPNRTLALGGIAGAGHLIRRALDIVGQHIVEEAHHVLDEALVAVPLVPGFEVERRQAADRGAIVTQMVAARGQRDFRAEVGGRNLQPQIAVMLGHRRVHMVAEHDVRLAGGEAGFDQLLEQRARIDLTAFRAVLGAAQRPFAASADAFHEFVGDEDAVVEVQRLAVEVSARFADFEEFLDFRVAHIEIAGRRATTQRALRDRECQRIHDADERDDAAGLAVQADRLADATHRAPIGADAATARGEPHILVPGLDDALQAVGDRVEIAANR